MLQGQTLGELGSSLITFGGTLGSIRRTGAPKVDAAGDQADIAKTYENLWFFNVLEVWGVILEACRSSGLVSGTLNGRRLAGWGAGWCWLRLAGRLAGRWGGHRDS